MPSESDRPQAVQMPQQAAWDGVPIAWAAVGKNGQPMWLSYSRQDSESAVVGMAKVVPLYRSPTLTDAEREAISTAMNAYGEMNDNRECEMIEATLWALLDRTK